MSKDSPRDEFLRRMAAGEAIPPELLAALAEQMKKTPRTTDRNQLIRAAVQLLMRLGRTKAFAIEQAFKVYGGPQDERERRRIVNDGVCNVLARVTRVDDGVVEVFWSDDPNAVVHLVPFFKDGVLHLAGSLNARYWAEFDLNVLDPPGGYRRPAEPRKWEKIGHGTVRLEYPDKEIKPPSTKPR